MSEHKKVEEEKQRLHDLNERVKELTALHHTARLLQDHERTPQMLLQEIVTILPAAWEHPEIAAARIMFDGVEYRTPNFVSTPWTQSAVFRTAGGRHGLVEITYLKGGPTQTSLFFSLRKRVCSILLRKCCACTSTAKRQRRVRKRSPGN